MGNDIYEFQHLFRAHTGHAFPSAPTPSPRPLAVRWISNVPIPKTPDQCVFHTGGGVQVKFGGVIFTYYPHHHQHHPLALGWVECSWPPSGGRKAKPMRKLCTIERFEAGSCSNRSNTRFDRCFYVLPSRFTPLLVAALGAIDLMARDLVYSNLMDPFRYRQSAM